MPMARGLEKKCSDEFSSNEEVKMRKKTKAASALPEVTADENGGIAIAEGVARVDLSTLRENPNNPQKVVESEFECLRDSMRRLHRFLKDRPMLVEADGMVKCGNKRLRALKANGVRFVPAEYVRIFSDYTPEEVAEFILQDNLHRGVWDAEKLLAGLRGRLVLTLTSVMIVQMVTQTNEGGMTGTYLDGGTYLKSFYSVMAAPSCVRISMLHGGTKDTAQHWRIHHHVKWENCAAKVLSAKWRKAR